MQTYFYVSSKQFTSFFVNKNIWITINISLKFVPKGQIYNIPALVQIMAWRRPGDKPSSETMMTSLPTHIYVTRPQWVKHFCDQSFESIQELKSLWPISKLVLMTLTHWLTLNMGRQIRTRHFCTWLSASFAMDKPGITIVPIRAYCVAKD